MIPLGHPQHLGFKAFILMSFRFISPAIGIVIVAAFLTLFHETLITATLNINSLMYPDTLLSSMVVETYIGYLVLILLGLALIGFVGGILLAWLFYHYYTFTLGDYDLRLKRGILHREEISIPYRQMQNVNIIRSLFYQIIGVSKLYIDSAGNEDPGEPDTSEIILRPIEKELAEEIRSLLQHRIGVQMVEDTTALGHHPSA
jgi:uncharacterized membrane protein YdbT with pleckstrin-like domain